MYTFLFLENETLTKKKKKKERERNWFVLFFTHTHTNFLYMGHNSLALTSTSNKRRNPLTKHTRWRLSGCYPQPLATQASFSTLYGSPFSFRFLPKNTNTLCIYDKQFNILRMDIHAVRFHPKTGSIEYMSLPGRPKYISRECRGSLLLFSILFFLALLGSQYNALIASFRFSCMC